MKYMRKKLRDIKPGDMVVDINGDATRVESVTPVRVSREAYKVTLKNHDGRLAVVKADAEHLWPMASPLNGMLSADARDKDYLTTRELYENYRDSKHAMFSPAYGDSTISYWQVYCVTVIDPIEVQCLRVESETHTFLIAARQGDASNAPVSNIDYVVENGIPTHNCGGPLTLDTRLKRYMGGTVSMGDVHVGDVLVTENGEPTTVLEESPIMMADTLYEVTLEPVEP